MFNMIQLAAMTVSTKIRAFAKEEKGAVDIVAIVVLIGIAVLLATVFKESIEELLRGLFKEITSGATEAVKGG